MSDLNGPDISDEPREEIVEEVGDAVEVWAWQFCNRWVFLAHQRPAALKELYELIAEARNEVSLLQIPNRWERVGHQVAPDKLPGVSLLSHQYAMGAHTL